MNFNKRYFATWVSTLVIVSMLLSACQLGPQPATQATTVAPAATQTKPVKLEQTESQITVSGAGFAVTFDK